MASQTKILFLHLLLAVLLLSEVFAQRTSSSRSRYSRNRQASSRTKTRYRSGRIRSGECKDLPAANETCVKIVKELGVQACHTNIGQLKFKLERSCSKTCNFCGAPQTRCTSTRYGCCWDIYTSRGDNYGRDCPECKDHLHLCRRFKQFCTARKLENRLFMELHCPVTCRKCNARRGVALIGQRVKMSDWNKL